MGEIISKSNTIKREPGYLYYVKFGDDGKGTMEVWKAKLERSGRKKGAKGK
ncbi:hypothetical protein M0R04_14740 [Candidatus Dojkabacteria bacterium]|jgi:hypothetical protein|nr:hypothetical protein [Candidatus Dojkabacteria bacterium]